MKRIFAFLLIALMATSILVVSATAEEIDTLFIPKFVLVDENGNEVEPKGRTISDPFVGYEPGEEVKFNIVEEDKTGTLIMPEKVIRDGYAYNDIGNSLYIDGCAHPNFVFEAQVSLNQKPFMEMKIGDEFHIFKIKFWMSEDEEQWFPYTEHMFPTFANQQWFCFGTKAEVGEVTLRSRTFESRTAESINVDYTYTFAIEDLMKAPDGQLTFEENGVTWIVRLPEEKTAE